MNYAQWIIFCKIFSGLALFIISLIGIIPLYFRKINKDMLSIANSFSAGLLLSISLIHLMPQSYNILMDVYEGEINQTICFNANTQKFPWTFLSIIVTYSLMLLIENIIFKYQKRRSGRTQSPSTGWQIQQCTQFNANCLGGKQFEDITMLTGNGTFEAPDNLMEAIQEAEKSELNNTESNSEEEDEDDDNNDDHIVDNNQHSNEEIDVERVVNNPAVGANNIGEKVRKRSNDDFGDDVDNKIHQVLWLNDMDDENNNGTTSEALQQSQFQLQFYGQKNSFTLSRKENYFQFQTNQQQQQQSIQAADFVNRDNKQQQQKITSQSVRSFRNSNNTVQGYQTSQKSQSQSINQTGHSKQQIGDLVNSTHHNNKIYRKGARKGNQVQSFFSTMEEQLIQEKKSKKRRKNRFRPSPLFLMLIVHSIVEGLAIGLQAQIVKILCLTAALILHKVAESITLCKCAFDSKVVGKKRIIIIIIVYSIVTPIGVAIGSLIRSEESLSAAILLSAVAGALLFISATKLISQELHASKKLMFWKYLFYALSILIISLFWFIEQGLEM